MPGEADPGQVLSLKASALCAAPPGRSPAPGDGGGWAGGCSAGSTVI